ncbi:MAG: hypothetical protein IJC93_05155 [Clostridia bacterium]|nr:hypothetical protein [Clostridia bacterium]
MPVKDISRFESAVCALESARNVRGGVLLLGSSTFARFPAELAVRAFSPLPVTRCGFGGSTAEEALYYYPRLVAPQAPEILVWYEGDNDPHFGYTASDAFRLSRRVWERARADFPGLRLVLVGVKDTPGETEANRERRAYNHRLKEYVAARSFAAYADLPAALNLPDGKPQKAYFCADGIHLSTEGYELLTERIRAAILELNDGKL